TWCFCNSVRSYLCIERDAPGEIFVFKRPAVDATRARSEMTNGGPLKNKNHGVDDGIYRQATPNGVKGTAECGRQNCWFWLKGMGSSENRPLRGFRQALAGVTYAGFGEFG